MAPISTYHQHHHSVITSSQHNNKGFVQDYISSYSQHQPCHQGFKIFINHQSLNVGPNKIKCHCGPYLDLSSASAVSLHHQNIITGDTCNQQLFLASASASAQCNYIITKKYQGFRAVYISSYSQLRPCHHGFKIHIKCQSLTLGPIKINQKITFHVDLQ